MQQMLHDLRIRDVCDHLNENGDATFLISQQFRPADVSELRKLISSYHQINMWTYTGDSSKLHL